MELESLMQEVKHELRRVGDDVTRRVESLETRQLDLEQRVAGGSSIAGRGFGSGGAKSLGEQVVDSSAFDGFRQSPSGSIRIKVQQAITTLGDSGGALIPSDKRTDPVMLPRRRLTVRDLLNPGRTTAGLVEYPKQTTRTNNADVVSEGAEKPESNYAWEAAEAPVRTIAHWVPVSRQAMDDAPMLQSVIDGELRYGLDLVEETQLLKGDGTGQNLSGLVTEATAFSAPFTVTSENMADVILLAIAQLAASEITATGVILNPQDWSRMQALKDGENRYLAGGPFADTPPVLWRLPVVLSNSMDEDEFLVGDFRRAATIYDRMDAEVLISSEDRDNFIKNMLTVRAEKRLALAVTMPSALITGDFGNIT